MSESEQWEVLLVEDKAADIYLIQKAIAQCKKNIRLWFVSNGPDALRFLRQEAPFLHVPSSDLIISDLNLPWVRGYEFLEELRCLPAHQQTPVVIFSAVNKEWEEHRCLQLGATQYVQKPSDPASFFAAIKALVETWLRPGGAGAHYLRCPVFLFSRRSCPLSVSGSRNCFKPMPKERGRERNLLAF